MNLTLKTCVFIAMFSLCLIFYLLLPVFYGFFDPTGESKLWMEISKHTGTEFVLLLLFAAIASLGLTSFINFFYDRIRRWGRRRTKIGETLVSLNIITEEDLNKALAQQKLRLSDILVIKGRISPEQRDLAMELQKKNNKKTGDILMELGFITEKELHWALQERNRKIGGILKEMNLVSDYDIDCALKCRMDKNGNIIDIQ